MACGDHRAGSNHIAAFTDGDIDIGSTFFGGVYHKQGEFILIVHTSVSNNTLLSGFGVIYTDSCLSLAILYLWHVATIRQDPMISRHSTDADIYISPTFFGGVYHKQG